MKPGRRSTTTSEPSTILIVGTRPSVTSVRWTTNGNTLPERQHSGTVYGNGSAPLCLGLPLVYRHGPTEAGFTVSNARRWLPLAGAVSIAVLAAGEVGRHVSLVTLLPAGWERVINLAHPWWVFVAYSILVNAFCEEYLWRGFLLPRT